MATFTTETVTTTVHRWIIPAAEPWGAPADEISKAWAVAAAAYRRAHGLAETDALAGNALCFRVLDEAVVIEFKTESPARGGCCDCPHEMEA